MINSDITTIKPYFENGLNVNEVQIYTYDTSISNNSSILLDFSELVLNLTYTLFGQNYIVNSITPVKVQINWDDNNEEEINYKLLDNSSTTLEKELIHYYDLSKEQIGQKNISISLYDAIGNRYKFIISINIVMQSFYDMDIELDIEKIMFNNDIALTVFSAKDISTTKPKLSSYNSPIISILS